MERIENINYNDALILKIGRFLIYYIIYNIPVLVLKLNILEPFIINAKYSAGIILMIGIFIISILYSLYFFIKETIAKGAKIIKIILSIILVIILLMIFFATALIPVVGWIISILPAILLIIKIIKLFQNFINIITMLPYVVLSILLYFCLLLQDIHNINTDWPITTVALVSLAIYEFISLIISIKFSKYSLKYGFLRISFINIVSIIIVIQLIKLIFSFIKPWENAS